MQIRYVSVIFDRADQGRLIGDGHGNPAIIA
jgi:hypothetical protein